MARVEIEQREPNRQLNYVFGLVRLTGSGGRGRTIHIGWDTEGYPCVATSNASMTQEAHEAESEAELQTIQVGDAARNYELVAYDFTEMAKAIDNSDRGRNFTEDILTLACVSKSGGIDLIEVKELTLLKSILENQVVWGEEGSKSFSLLIPDQENEKMNILLFDPAGGYTNELSYRTFLLNVIKTLSEIDRNQNPPDQKGYVGLIESAIEDAENKKIGDPTGNEKVMMNLGVLMSNIRGSQRLAYLNVDQLRYLIDLFYEEASTSFELGKL